MSAMRGGKRKASPGSVSVYLIPSLQVVSGELLAVDTYANNMEIFLFFM